MNRVEISLDSNNELVVKLLSDPKSMYVSSVLKGEDAYTFVSEMAKYPINDIKENSKENYAHIEYQNCNVTVNNYLNLLYTEGFYPLTNRIKKYFENKELKKHKEKRKKVTRKNKHSLTNVILSGLALMIVASCAHSNALMKKLNSYSTVSASSHTSSYSVDDLDLNKSGISSSVTLDNDISSINYQEEEKTEDKKIVESIDYSNSENINNNENIISINYSDRSSTEKANLTRTSYGNLISKYSKMYGLDPKLVTAIATQERGVHSTTMDSGGATGLMQIQNSVWVGNKLSAHNFETNSVETVTVDSSNISNLESNIKMGCMIFQNTLKYMNYNVLAAIQCYNMGYGNMTKVLADYAIKTNRTVKEVLEDDKDYGWLECRDLIKVGDQNYIENVLSWIGASASINVNRTDGTVVNLNVNNQDTLAKSK